MTAKDIYDNCRSWLQFAETKNGFALAFCSAVIAAEVSLLSGVGDMLKPFVMTSIFLVTMAAICSLVSFIPQLGMTHSSGAGQEPPPGGIVYFGHIARRDNAAYIAQATKLLGIKDSDAMSVELLSQCHSLSVIIVRKLRLFYASVLIAGFGIISPLLGAAGRWLCV